MSKNKNPYPVNPIIASIVQTLMYFFCLYHRITATTTKEIRNRKEPFLLLSNHVGELDPFILSNYLKKVPNYVASDAILRDRVIGTIFKLLGAMPKRKGIRDSVIIREMVKVVQAGGSPCIFPEAARTWDGKTLYIDPSIAKLIRLLNIPVVTARMKGAYMYNPRWSRSFRRASMQIDFHEIIPAGNAKCMKEDEIMALVNEHLYHDDIEYQRQHRQPIQSPKRAEFLDTILFQCPSCKSFDGFTSAANEFSCISCNDAYHVDDFGFFTRKKGSKPMFDNPRDWMRWESENWIREVVRLMNDDETEVLFETENVAVECATGSGRMEPLGDGTVAFTKKGIQLTHSGNSTILPFTDIEYIGPQFQERLECSIYDKAYRFTSTTKKEPGIKWELAMSVVFHLTNQPNKVSPYLREVINSTLK